MEFDLKKEKPKAKGISQDDFDLAYAFTQKLYKEFGTMLKAVVLFGSNAKPHVSNPADKEQKVVDAVPKKDATKSDIDILVVVDDVSMMFSPEIVETYRIIVKKVIVEVSDRLHITSLKLSSFWGYIRVGDPVGLNILREGVSLLDSGFFDPLKALLSRGMIRPSAESIATYFHRAPYTLANSKWHIMQGVVDLYWAVMDATHAAIMTQNVIPPTPENAPSMLNELLVKKGMLSNKAPLTVRKFFKLYKSITKREIKDISGKEFDAYFKEAEAFVDEIRNFIKKRKFSHAYGI